MKLTEAITRRRDQHHDLFRRIQNGEAVWTQIPTGITAWNRAGGLRRTLLHLLVIPSGHGKSHMAFNLARAAAKAGFRVNLVSMEDPEEESIDRLFAGETGINSSELSDIAYDEGVLRQIDLATAEMATWADNINYETGLKTASQIDELVQDTNTDLDIIDYVQALPSNRGMTLEETLSTSAFAWNAAAQRKRKAVVAMSQTKPEVESRGKEFYEANRNRGYPLCVQGWRPYGKDDIQRCTALYDRSKIVGYGWRPGKYGRKLGCTEGGKIVKDNRFELNFDKFNFRAEGGVSLGIDLAHSRFYDLEAA